jgi:hypothetical protein
LSADGGPAATDASVRTRSDVSATGGASAAAPEVVFPAHLEHRSEEVDDEADDGGGRAQ